MRVLSIILGIFTIGAGIIVIVNPVVGGFTIAWLMGIFFLMSGACSIIGYFTDKRGTGWSVFFGIISAITGGLLLVNGFADILANQLLVIFVSVAMVFSGVSQLFAARAFKEAGRGMALPIISGILSILVGGLGIVNPLAGFFMINFLFAFILISQGINMIAEGCFFRMVNRRPY